MTLAIVNDYVFNRRIKIFLDDGDMEFARQNWNESDPILVNLQDTDAFRGRTHWCELDPFHYRIMICRNIAKLFEGIEPGDELDPNTDAFRSLTVLISLLVCCLETRSSSHIEMIRLLRLSNIDLGVEFEAALQMELPDPRPKKTIQPTPKSPFAIIVDNTDRE